MKLNNKLNALKYLLVVLVLDYPTVVELSCSFLTSEQWSQELQCHGTGRFEEGIEDGGLERCIDIWPYHR